MGMYINAINGIPAPGKGKADFILKHVKGALVVPAPTIWHEELVCVVDNFAFDAAAYAYDEGEMRVFLSETRRPTKWLFVPEAKKYAK